jgi:hypothetical protein
VAQRVLSIQKDPGSIPRERKEGSKGGREGQRKGKKEGNKEKNIKWFGCFAKQFDVPVARACYPSYLGGLDQEDVVQGQP